ncbi:four helix bundle protein [Hymenobacter sp. 102]|uniref:four helix bundle protein n=1 Tax=Hymenobacter sp. 102 TaxID=3403152 RepID=UPI003CEFBBAB
MAYEPLEERRLYVRAELVADGIWELVAGWPEFARDTVGKQLVRAADSIGANIAEGGGRFHPGEVRQFLYYARGSLRETKFFLRRAAKRMLINEPQFQAIDSELEQLAKEINATINYQKTRSTQSPNHPIT